jgi:hypothetical protein
LDNGTSYGLDLIGSETLGQDGVQEEVNSGLQVVWAMFAGLNSDGASQNLSVAHVVGLHDVSQLLIGSEGVEAGLLQELEENSDDGRPVIGLFSVLEVTQDGRVWVRQVALGDGILLLNVVNCFVIKL